MVLSIAIPASAQAPQKAKHQLSVAKPAAPARDVREFNPFATVKTFTKGQGQFKKHHFGKPGKKYAAPYKASGMSNFFANFTYDSSWEATGEADYGIFSVSTTSPCVVEKVSGDEEIALNGGGTITPTSIVGTQYENFWGMIYAYTYVIDPTTYEVVASYEADLTGVALGMAYDPVSENVYGLFYNEGGSSLTFGTFDVEGGTSNLIAEIGYDYSSIVISRTGVVYLLSEGGDIATINKVSGEITPLGNFGVTSDYPCASVMDPISNVIYYTTSPETANSELYAIDPAKPNEANLVYEFPGNVQYFCAYFPVLEAEEDAPGKPVVNTVDFKGISLSGSINFTAPATLYSGENPTSGETLKYEVLANGEVIAQGSKVQYGHSYTLAIQVPKPDLYQFQVVVYNAAGASPMSARVEAYVGPDGPAPVKGVNASYADGKMTITWDAVTEGAHNGILGNVTYAVYNADDNSLIAEALTGTTYSFDLKEPAEFAAYTFYVVATADGIESKAGYSNVVPLGAIMPPYANSLTDPDNLLGWTFVDNNNDGKTWEVTETGLTYTYHSRNTADDYAITPPVKIQKGRMYEISMSAANRGTSFPEKVELLMLKSASDFSNAESIIATQTIKSTTFQTFTTNYTATEDAKVYFAIHAVSDPDEFYLYVKDFSIGAPLMAAAPAAATNLNVLANFDGTPEGTLSYTAPTTAINGTALTSLDKIEVLVNDKIIFVDNNPTPGAASSVKYTAPESGKYEFAVIAYNAAGQGMPATFNVYLGVNVPSAPTNAAVKEVSDGVVTITWDAPATDQDGNAMNPDLVSYVVLDAYTSAIVADGVTGTELANFQACAANEQTFVAYAIFAQTETGISQGYAMTNDLCVGTPYTLPFEETFADAKVTHDWITSRNSTTIQALIVKDDYYTDLTSRNNDNGFVVIQGSYIDEALSLISGKIAVTEAEPYLTFYTFNIAANDANTLVVEVTCEDDTTTVYSTVLGEGTVGAWNRHTVDFKAFAGKQIQLAFTGTVKTYGNIFFDDIKLGDPVNYDLFAKSISAPKSLMHDVEFDINYAIENLGLKAAEKYTVQVYADGDLIETIENLPAIEPGATYEGKITHKPYSLFEAGTYAFSFVIEYAQDQDIANNGSDVVEVKVVNTNYPTVEIEGATADSTVTLTWETPLIDTSSSPVLESFESEDYVAWSTTEVGDWKILNFNNNDTYIINGLTTPVDGDAFGWALYDAASVGQTESSNVWGYEGPCFMGAMAHESGANDAWLISPQMMGIPQTITFMARSITIQYGLEQFECYYSTTGTEVADFTKVEVAGYENGVPAEWTEYSFSIPAGAKYFAIRCVSNDLFLLMVDNITYAGGSTFFDLELNGYDVYRDGAKINAETLAATTNTYTDNAPVGKHTYNVVVVYNNGMSAPSNDYETTIEDTGIADATTGSVITVEGNTIVVTGAENVVIAAADGKVVYTAAAQDTYKATVAAGVYVVKTNDATAKVIVK